jgi:hypothetical protein
MAVSVNEFITWGSLDFLTITYAIFLFLVLPILIGLTVKNTPNHSRTNPTTKLGLFVADRKIQEEEICNLLKIANIHRNLLGRVHFRALLPGKTQLSLTEAYCTRTHTHTHTP